MRLGCWSEKGEKFAVVCGKDVRISQSRLLDILSVVQAVGQDAFRLLTGERDERGCCAW